MWFPLPLMCCVCCVCIAPPVNIDHLIAEILRIPVPEPIMTAVQAQFVRAVRGCEEVLR